MFGRDICGDDALLLYILQNKKELKKKLLELVFGTPPAQYNAKLVIFSKAA